MIFINHSPLYVVFGRKFKDFPMTENCPTFICYYIDPEVYKTPIKPSVAIFLILANILASFLLLLCNDIKICSFFLIIRKKCLLVNFCPFSIKQCATIYLYCWCSLWYCIFHFLFDLFVNLKSNFGKRKRDRRDTMRNLWFLPVCFPRIKH